MDLKKKKCIPCEGDTKPMSAAEAKKYLKFAKDWELSDNKIYLNKKFKDFKAALKFINAVGKIAEQQGHHPDILLYSWNNIKLTLNTHAIGGLSINDFIMAAKINSIKKGL